MQRSVRPAFCGICCIDGRTTRRALLTALTAALLVGLLVSCTSGSGSPIPQGAVEVIIKGNPLGNPDSSYKPSTLRIHTGQTVVWVDRDDSKHTVTPDFNYSGWKGSDGSGILSPNQRYSHRFLVVGTYRYHCMVHQNMLGVVIVRKR